jgi:hypothetical protein
MRAMMRHLGLVLCYSWNDVLQRAATARERTVIRSLAACQKRIHRLICNRVLAVAVVAVLLSVGGCRPAPMGPQRHSPTSLPAGEDSAAFLDLLLLDGKDDTTSFQQRHDALVERGIVARSWSVYPNRPLTRGRLAYMVYQAMKLPGGLILTLTGPTQRYCLRELEYQKFMAQGNLLIPVTGLEFVAVLTRADAYIRNGVYPCEEAPD